jgi:hypothetical protein
MKNYSRARDFRREWTTKTTRTYNSVRRASKSHATNYVRREAQTADAEILLFS